MVDEMAALHSNGTWDLVVLPSGKSTVGCRWVYAVKVGPDGQVDRLKARLVAKGYTQVYGSDYGDTFSPVAKIASVRLLLSMAAMCSWPLYQLDIKNAFLHGDLAEEVYMEQPPGFVAQGESGLVCRLRRSLYGLKQSPRAWFSRFSSVVQEFGMLRSTADHSVFNHHNSLGQCIYLVVYVDDIVITGSDQDGIQKLKQHLFTHFQTKDLGKLKYFLGIEIAQSSSGVSFPKGRQGEPLGDPGRYRRLVGKLNYLTITRPDISFPVSVVSQFLQSPCDSHWDAVIRILRYIKSTPGQGVLYQNRGHTQVVGYTDADWAGSPTDRRSTSGYCVFIGGNLISWKSKKQDVVARSSAEAEYRAMALATCELIWLRHLLQELRFGKDEQMKLICDNQAALHIASNPVFHERTKHIEVDCHFIREKIASGCIATSFVNSNDQLADIFTKSLRGLPINYNSKRSGGLGVKSLGAFNRALLGKWVWRLANERKALWNQVIRGKYREERGGWESVSLGRPTGIVKFWKDKWCETIPLSEAFPSLFALASNKEAWVNEVWTAEGEWGEVGTLVSIDLSTIGSWKKWKGYFVAWREEAQIELFCVGGFLGRVLTLDRSQKRGWVMANRCFLCHKNEETIDHLLIHCEKTREVWMVFLSFFGVSWVFPVRSRKPFRVEGFFCGKERKVAWQLGPLCLFWVIWKARNSIAFEDCGLSIQG
ncbi:Retrovirus-related Pol polyprotein from transposon RE2 [Vitis vinifera]|uniref:Retrovirus-related Pol polyprotein from transposon RE2 n=1 Tax=Vitis vinifera TaxID=29760 RepID=A0A438FIS5_VITVI|nr:Retrovirus-related Pol polyprotein from transposon RE2 [Vitis vinifera]